MGKIDNEIPWYMQLIFLFLKKNTSYDDKMRCTWVNFRGRVYILYIGEK